MSQQQNIIINFQPVNAGQVVNATNQMANSAQRASAAYAGLAQQINQVNVNLNQNQANLNGSGGGGGGGSRRPAAGMAGLLGPVGSQLFAAMGLFTLALNSITHALQSYGNALKSYANPNATESRRLSGIVEQMPLFGGMWKAERDTRDALAGHTGQMAANEFNFPQMKRRLEGRYELQSKQSELTFGVFGAEAQAQATKQNAYAPYAATNRGTYAGKIAAQQQSILLPAMDDYTRAQRNNQAAKSVLGEQEKRYQQALAQQNEARQKSAASEENLRKRREAEKSLIKDRNPSGIDSAARLAEKDAQEALLAQKRTSEELNRLQEARNNAARAEGDLRKASLEVMKADLEVAKGREARLTGKAQGLGQLTENEFQQGLQALQMVQQGGITNIPPELARMAEQVNPQYIAQLREQAGSDRLARMDQETQKVFGAGAADSDLKAAGSLKGAREQVDKLEADVRVTMQVNEEKLADSIAKALSASVAAILDQIKVKMEEELRQFRAGFLQKQNEVG